MTTGIIIGTIVGVVLTFFTALTFNNMDAFDEHEWVFLVLIVGMLYIVLFAARFGFVGYDADNENKINETIQDTLNSNYDNVVNFHNGNTNKSFVSDGSKYTFDYDKKTKTLTVFTDTNSSVDAVFINGIKQNNSVKKEKTSDNTKWNVKKKDCVSYQTDDKNKTNDKVDTDNASSTTTVTDTDLQQKIQNKIQSKYNGAVMTSFDTINLSGTFSCDDIQYNFAYKDNMLEVSNINDINDVTYYKISN